MTRIPLPPAAVLSQNGVLAGSVYGPDLSLLNLASASLASVTLPHEARLLAFSPRGTYLAVAGGQHVTLLRPEPPYPVLGTVAIPAPLFRLAVAEEGTVVGVLNFGGERTTLGVWRGAELRADFVGEGTPLGRSAPFQLLLDGARERVLLAGVRGPSAFSGGGERFIALLSLEAGQVAVSWKGEGLPFPPERFLFPLADGRLGVTAGSELAVVALPPEVAESRVISRVGLPDLEKVAASPGGAYLAVLNGMGPDTESRVRLARLDGEILGEAPFRGLGSFPALAVGDAGRVAIVSSERPNRLRALWLINGKLEERMTAEVAAEETV